MIERIKENVIQLPMRSMKKDDFLKLLVAQLKNQSPLSPLEDREFLVQMTQITMLEQLVNVVDYMKNLKLTVQRTNTLSLLGKEVDILSVHGERLKGAINALRFGEEPFIEIAGKEVGLSEISYISVVA